jgi:hypothetical protein
MSHEYARQELPLVFRGLFWPRRRISLASMRVSVLLGFGIAGSALLLVLRVGDAGSYFLLACGIAMVAAGLGFEMWARSSGP